MQASGEVREKNEWLNRIGVSNVSGWTVLAWP